MKPALKAAGRKDFNTFVRKAFREMHGFILEDDYVDYLCFEAAKVATQESRRMVVTMPPRHLKTFTLAVCLPAWILGRDPKAKIMIITYGEDLAKDIAHNAMTVVCSPWYREIFDTRIAKNRFSVMD